MIEAYTAYLCMNLYSMFKSKNEERERFLGIYIFIILMIIISGAKKVIIIIVTSPMLVVVMLNGSESSINHTYIQITHVIY